MSDSNRDKERLVHHPSSTDDGPPSSINHNDNYSTFTPKANDDDKTRNTNSKDEEEEDATCCCDCCCDCWKEYRFVVMLALVLLACLAVPLYFLVRHAHFEFDYHRECVTCFNDKEDFEVIFNQTNGTCELYVQNETYDSNNIVLDPNFCGAPHCQSLELLPGLRLVPYWAIAVSAVFSIVLSVGVNLIKYNCYLPIKKRFVTCVWDQDLVEQNPVIRLADEYGGAIREAVEKEAQEIDKLERSVDEYITRSYGANDSEDQLRHLEDQLRQLKDLRQEPNSISVESDLECLRWQSLFLKTFGLTDPYFFILLFLFAAGHFIFSVHEVVTKPAFAHLDGWHKYQTIYGLFLNSGSIEVLWFSLSMWPVRKSIDLKWVTGFNDVTNYLKRNVSLVPQQLWEDAEKMRDNMGDTVIAPLLQFEYECVRVCFVYVYYSFAVLATAPVFLTHVVPGIVLFIPYWSWILLALFFASMFGFCFLDRGFEERDFRSVMFLPSMALLRLIVSLFVLLLFPMIFNWTVLFYEGRTWSDVMTGEYRLRNTDCYFNALVNNIQIYNVGFVGLIFS